MRRPTGDEGSGTVLLLGLVCVVVLLAASLALLASAQSARGRAQSAADLAALAGASGLLPGVAGDPCGRAAETVNRNGGRMVGCQDEGMGVVEVHVVVATRIGIATAQARAGPAAARG